MDWVALSLISAAVMLSPLAMGSVSPWAAGGVFCLSMLALLVWLLRDVRAGRFRFVKSWLFIVVMVFFAWGLLQLVPLPAGAVRALSPAAADSYQRLLPQPDSARHTLSVHPYGTRAELFRLLSLAAVFVVTLHVVRRRAHATALVLALLAVALFECFYGFGEQFSGSRRIFWVQRTVHLSAVTGTYINKNHFAGLLEMALPLCVGLLLALLPRGRAPGAARARLLMALSSGRKMMTLFLPAAIILMAAGICLSLSRAGIACAFLSLTVFAVCLGLSFGFRRHTLVLLFLVLGVLLFVGTVGSEVVFARVEDAATGRATSWADRLNLSRSGMEMARAFPLVGSGLGTFRYAFERFQSPRFGDRVGDFLHNDWLQLACETGVVGLALVFAGVVLFSLIVLRAAFTRRDPFCRWVSLGAYLGALALLFHSFFDYNLLKITSNGAVFAMLCGLAWAVSHMPSEESDSRELRRYAELRLGGLPARAVAGVLLTGAVAAACIVPIRRSLADLEFNRCLVASGRPADSTFLLPLRPTQDPVVAAAALVRARRLDPSNPRYVAHQAIALAGRAHDMDLARAEDSARLILGDGASEETIRSLAEVLSRGLSLKPAPGPAALLAEARERAAQAVAMSPVAAQYHLNLAEISAALVRPAEGAEALRSAARAEWLAPGKPGILFGAARVSLLQAPLEPDSAERARLTVRAVECFRRVLAADPAYADRVYPLALAVLGPEAKPYITVTPRSLPACQRLAQLLWDSGEWDELLECLREMERLCDEQVAAEELNPWTLTARDAPTGESGIDFSPTSLVSGGYDLAARRTRKLWVRQRRAAVLGLMGRWTERAAAMEEYRRLLSECLAGEVDAARRDMERRRYEETLTRCRMVLDQDWGSPEALLVAAQAADALNLPSVGPRWEGALDHLYRLVILNSSLDPDVARRAGELAASIHADNDSARSLQAFIPAAAAVLSGQAESAIPRLRELAESSEEHFRIWRQRHLYWHYLGLACEKAGRTQEAAQAYAAAVELVPAFDPALRRLAALRGDEADRRALAELTPAFPCRVRFSGRITLLGYGFQREPVSLRVAGVEVSDEAWFLRCYWRLEDRLSDDFGATLNFCDDSWRALFHGNHRIVDEGRAYPLDFVRHGEVVVTTVRLPRDPSAVPYLSIGVGRWGGGIAGMLSHDAGPGPIRLRTVPHVPAAQSVAIQP